ncbi:hypothetical protein RB2083_1326 [Rhodobacteraceae bacterium HTCC2083]|nr:hypothetical protein RB2083_1326 [Rhodobacteraceae bacterium HTCC2083]
MRVWFIPLPSARLRQSLCAALILINLLSRFGFPASLNT